MGRTYGSFCMLFLFQLIKISCYNISRGYATDLFKRIILISSKIIPTLQSHRATNML